MQPDSADAHYNLGNALVRQGRAAEAITQFAEAIRLFPDNATFQCALASSLTEQGETDAALPHYETALALEPDNADAHYNLGGALLTKGPGGLAVASAHFQRAIELRPDDDGANASLGDCFYLAGRTDKAVAQWEKALALNPRRMSTSANLAWVLATSQEIPSRNGFKAVGLAEQAIRVGGGTNPIMLRALAAAYAEASRFPEAVASARQAAQLALAEGNTALVAELQEQLRLYQAGQPFRDTSSNATITIDVRLRRYQAGQPYHDPGP